MELNDKNIQMQNLENRLHRIIEWVRTCDSKATTLLSITALVLTILLAGDYIMNGMQTIISSVYNPKMTELSVFGLFAVISFVASIGLLVVSLVYCIHVLQAKTNENQTLQTSIVTDSLIHFNHISKLTYEQFSEQLNSETDEQYIEDLKSQIHINAVRCAEKFKDYNIAIRTLKFAIPCSLVYICFTVLYLATIV